MKQKTERPFIISELHPQHGGDIKTIETMILQSKMGGADAVKVQVYTSMTFLGDNRKQYAEITFEELKRLKKYADNIGIDLFASVFDSEKLDWCLHLEFKYLKIASKMFKDDSLCREAIATQKPVFISNGLNPDEFPYFDDNVYYFHCIPKYPMMLEDNNIPNFRNSLYSGFSDHSPGLTAAITAVVRGAIYVEKHFTLSSALQSSSEKAHTGSMNFDELRSLRKFCDEFSILGGCVN